MIIINLATLIDTDRVSPRLPLLCCYYALHLHALSRREASCCIRNSHNILNALFRICAHTRNDNDSALQRSTFAIRILSHAKVTAFSYLFRALFFSFVSSSGLDASFIQNPLAHPRTGWLIMVSLQSDFTTNSVSVFVCVECEADTSLPPALRKITITPHMHAHFNCAAFMHTLKHTLRISAGTVFYGGLAHRLRHPRSIHASSQHRRQHGRRTDYEHGPWPPFQAAHGARLQVRRTGPYLWNTHLLRDICIQASARDYDSKLRRSPALVDPCVLCKLIRPARALLPLIAQHYQRIAAD